MINWRAIPFLRLLVPLLSGIILEDIFPFVLPAWSWLLIGIVLVFSIRIKIFRFKWLFGLICFSFLLSLGHQLTHFYNELNHEDHFQRNLTAQHKIIGQVASAPKEGKRISMHLKITHRITPRGNLEEVSGNLLLYAEKDSLGPQLKYGDQLYLNLPVHRIPPPSNPKAFDFQKYMHHQNIHFQAFAHRGQCFVVSENKGNRLMIFSQRLRRKMSRILQEGLSTENEFAVGSALIIGNRNALTDGVKNAYTQTGAIHILAVSGMHVGLFAWMVGLLLGWSRPTRRFWKWIKTILLILSLWAFALLTGASASVMRAAFMFSLFLLAFAARRISNSYNIIGASAFCLLIFNPFLLYDVGFQLSYLAVLGIIYFTPKIYRAWYIENWIGRYIWKLSAVSLAAQISTLPISLYYFHQFPLYFLLSGLVVVPLAPVILSTGMLLFLLAKLPVAGWLISQVLYGSIWLMNALIFLIQQIPGHLIQGIWIGLIPTLLLYALIITFTVAVKLKNFRCMVAASALLLSFSIGYAFQEIRERNNQQIVIYHIPKNSLIDFVDGHTIFSLSSKGLTAQQEIYSAQNLRWAAGANHLIPKHFEETVEEACCLYYKNGMIQFYEKRLAIIDQFTPLAKTKKIKVDALLLRHNTRVKIELLRQQYDFEMLIFDGSNRRASVEKWALKCHDNNWPYHYTGDKGAYVMGIR